MRSGRVIRIMPEADPVYGNRLLTRFINRVMRSGKKHAAQAEVYKALEYIRQKGEDPIKVFELAIANAGPKMEVKARRVGGASYQVPTEVRGDRRVALAMRWIVGFANKRSNKEYKSFAEKLAVELMEAAKTQGDAIKNIEWATGVAKPKRGTAHCN